jgi:hypothetical protein
MRRLGNSGVGNRALDDAGQELTQKGRFQIGGDSAAFGDLEAKEGLHVAVGYHHANRRQGTCARTLVREVLHEGFQQHLGAMGRADANHGSQNTPRQGHAFR